MKLLLPTIFIILAVGFSACSTHTDDNYYDRANKASEKIFKGFRDRYKITLTRCES